jgi:HEAT repeat protein
MAKSKKKKKQKNASYRDVVALLHAEDYRKASKLGPMELKHLKRIVEEGDVQLTCKAVYVAGLLNLDDSVPVIEAAAKNRKRVIRVAAANAAGQLSPERAEPILRRLLKSRDVGIRKSAINSIYTAKVDQLSERMELLKNKENNPEVKKMIQNLCSKFNGR